MRTLAASILSAAPFYVFIWGVHATGVFFDHLGASPKNKKRLATRVLDTVPSALWTTGFALTVHATAWWSEWL
jgi:hypothetical protein